MDRAVVIIHRQHYFLDSETTVSTCVYDCSDTIILT